MCVCVPLCVCVCVQTCYSVVSRCCRRPWGAPVRQRHAGAPRAEDAARASDGVLGCLPLLLAADRLYCGVLRCQGERGHVQGESSVQILLLLLVLSTHLVEGFSMGILFFSQLLAAEWVCCPDDQQQQWRWGGGGGGGRRREHEVGGGGGELYSESENLHRMEQSPYEQMFQEKK